MNEDLFGNPLKMLRSASKLPTIRPVHIDSQEMARMLESRGYLEFIRDGEYRITEKGANYIKAKDAGRAPRSRRKPTMKPPPMPLQIVLHPKEFNQLSTRQRDILAFVDKYTKMMGEPPSYQEIGDGVGISGSSIVLRLTEDLIKAGWMQRTGSVKRSLYLTRDLPGGTAKNSIQVTRGVMRIILNLTGQPGEIVEAAQATIERLQEVIAMAQSGGES